MPKMIVLFVALLALFAAALFAAVIRFIHFDVLAFATEPASMIGACH